MNRQNLEARLDAEFPGLVEMPPEFRGETTLIVRDCARLPGVLRFLQRECAFDYLVDISSVDHLGEAPRFELVYELYSYGGSRYLRVKSPVPEDPAEAPTACEIWPTANWHEREIYDMMGIRFVGHPDLRRILMWDGYPHHPLRKDFPLEGLPIELPDGHFANAAPMDGGPYVTQPAELAHDREPRSKSPR